MVGFKNYQNPKRDFKLWEKELYKTMLRLGIGCKRVYKPKFRVSGRNPAGWIMYKVTNNEERGYLKYGDKEKTSSEKSSG